MKFWLKNTIKELYPDVDFDVLTPPNPEMGDYSVNLAFVLAKKDGRTPIEVGGELVNEFSKHKKIKEYFDRIEFVGPGFINFYLSEKFLKEEIIKIIEEEENYGSGKNKKFSIDLEFVSANPTGPLTVHNVRAAPYGDVLAGILKKAGYDVTKEYYINDSGNQVRIVGESVARKFLRLKGKTIEFPDNMYQGDYIVDIAREIDEKGMAENIEKFDELVNLCRDYAVARLGGLIKDSLHSLGIDFDVWFSEKKIHEKGEVESSLKILEKGKHIYDKDGARWLKINEEDGAVVVKSDGSYSYLMGDIAYTRDKFIRGFNKAINIWGTDHHGDVIRLKTGIKALGYEENKLEIILHQLVSIKSEGEKQRMSKRKGEFVLLDELLQDVGKDAFRYFFLAKDLNTHMEFDVALAKEQSKKNPVFYIQYAFARLNQIFGKLSVVNFKSKVVQDDLNLLKEKEEIRLVRKMSKFPELIEDIAQNYQVHHLAQYAYDLAADFHNFYEKHKVITEDKDVERARVALCRAVALVLGSCLNLMGITAPEKM
jgi:arginyl-tRNA synthetase